jgi:hypothetical protein
MDAMTPNAQKRRDRFVKVASRRTRRILEDVRLLGNCSNRAAYHYTADDIQKIFGAIDQELSNARSRFEPREDKRGAEFSLE